MVAFNERGRVVERGADCCDACQKSFPRPTHPLPRFLRDDWLLRRQEKSFPKKAGRLARAEQRAGSDRSNPVEKRPWELAVPCARAPATFGRRFEAWR